MTLNEYQDLARLTAKAQNPDHMAFGLLAEAGEVAGIFQRYHRGDKDYRLFQHGSVAYDLSNYAHLMLTKELGDVLWYLSQLADVLDLRLEDVAAKNIEKLQKRKDAGTIEGSGDDR